uniref:Putative cephalosporin hydroxylase n=1 Tax=viral metagenome TaxID=1070528 RepID=A0A6M3JJQ4_9ZZZZ
MQEIISKNNPDLIIETGTSNGGSALYLADISEPNSKVISIDTIHRDGIPQHDKITYICGSSLSDITLGEIGHIIKKNKFKRIMVLLDSIHLKYWVKAELDIYSGFVSKGQYLIVEDTNLNRHPVLTRPTAHGPWEAVHEWIKKNPEFIDISCEKFGFSFNPDGYLLRVQ